MRRIALAFVVLPLALAACGANEARVVQQQLTPTASVQQAAKKTAAATSAHLTFDGSGMLNGERETLTGSADFDIANGRGSFHADVPEYGAVDLVLDGNTAYVRAPFLKVFLPAGKTWLKLNGKMRRSLPNSVPQDPRQALARLKKLADVRKVGEEEIDGVTTTRYHGVARGHGTFDVWIGNDDGYLRRVSAEGSGRGGADGNVVITLSDFGEPVTVTPPPDSETADASALGALFKAKGFKPA